MTATNKIILFGSILLLGGFIAIGAVNVQNFNQQPVANAPVIATTTEKPTVDELLRLVNEERAKVSVAPLVLDERLNKSAQQKADDMLTRNYYEHVDPDGRHGYDIAHEYAPDICKKPAENLNMASNATIASDVVFSWATSESHYKAMVNEEFKYTGFGISDNKFVQHFC